MSQMKIQAHWRRIIDTMSEGMLIVGNDGRILMVNRSFEKLTGYKASEILGKPCTMLNCDACEKVLNESCSLSWCALFDGAATGIKKCRCTIIRKDGACLPVIKNASLLTDEGGEVIGAVETLSDLSEIDRLDREVALLSRTLDAGDGFRGIVGKSPVMQRVFDVVQKAALSEAPVLITGESGTGKELVARAIHDLGNRKAGPFIQLNCAALNESLLESELFGHVKGAFTGAYRHKTGRFEAASGGDIFLDEIGDMPPGLQAKLLRVLETKQFERVGDIRSVSADVRVISATNKKLDDMVKKGGFRKDLFFRINVIPIHLPPLRERTGDIPLLVNRFMKSLCKSTGKNLTGVARPVMDRFLSYQWPGNVRELKSTLEYAFVVAGQGRITREHLPARLLEPSAPPADAVQPTGAPANGDTAERDALINALMQTGGNQTRAAVLLGVNRVTVWNRMRKYGIDVKKLVRTESS